MRDLDLEVLDNHTGLGVIDSTKELSDHSESFWNDSTDLTGVISGLTEFDGQLNDVNTTKRRGAPKLVVVEGTRVHAEAEIWGTDEVLGAVEQAQEVGATRLLLGLENKGASWGLDTLKLQVFDSEHARECRVAIIGASTAVKVFASNDGIARSEALIPALHPWLLVKMTVEHDVFGAALSRLNHIDDHGAATFWLEDFLGDALELKLVNILVDEFHAFLDLTVREEVGIVVW